MANPSPTAAQKSFRCRHIHTAGDRCGSPALRGESFCYYHHATRRPPKHLGVLPPREAVFSFLPIEDRAAIQLALFDVLSRISANSIDPARAKLMLDGINAAARLLAKRDTANSTQSNDFDDQEFDPVVDLVNDDCLGPLAPIAEYDGPYEDQQSPSYSNRHSDRTQRSGDPSYRAQQIARQMAEEDARALSLRKGPADETPAQLRNLPDPTVNPDFYNDPARFGRPELADVCEAVRRAAALERPRTPSAAASPTATPSS